MYLPPINRLIGHHVTEGNAQQTWDRMTPSQRRMFWLSEVGMWFGIICLIFGIISIIFA